MSYSNKKSTINVLQEAKKYGVYKKICFIASLVLFTVVGVWIITDQFTNNESINEGTPIHTNERGEFYKFQAGIITSNPSLKYDGVYLLIPTESDEVCTFKKQGHYTWCADYFGDDGIRPYSIDICVDHNFNGIRTTDGYCLEILVMDYVDEFSNIAYKEQKLHFIDWKIFD